MTPAVELAAAFHSRFLAMLEAYADESSREDLNPRIFVVAGWIGDGAAWRDVEERWLEIISAPSLPSVITEFHSTDCLAGQGEFKSWPPAERDALRTRLLDSLVGARIGGVTATLTLDQTPAEAKKTYRFRKDYQACLLVCMMKLALSTATYPPRERVGFLIDEREKGQGDLQDCRYALRTMREIRERIGPVAFDDSREVVPLQAADLLAHETYLQRFNELSSRPFRDAFVKGLLPKLVHRETLHWDHATGQLFDYNNLPAGIPIADSEPA